MNSYKARERLCPYLFKLQEEVEEMVLERLLLRQKMRSFQVLFRRGWLFRFFKNELEFRKDLYPPFLKLARVVLSSANGLKIKRN